MRNSLTVTRFEVSCQTKRALFMSDYTMDSVERWRDSLATQTRLSSRRDFSSVRLHAFVYVSPSPLSCSQPSSSCRWILDEIRNFSHPGDLRS